MISGILTLFTVVAFLAACKKEDDSKVSSARLENGFYIDETPCEVAQFISATYISGDNYSLANLYVTPETCDAKTISDINVLAYSLEPRGKFSDFIKEGSDLGFTVGVQDGAIHITANDGSFNAIRTRTFDAIDRNKEMSLNVSELNIEKEDDMRNVSLRVSVNGPQLNYEPSMWCDSSVEAGSITRLEKVDFQGQSPSFALQAVVNDPTDSYRYTFPAKCQVTVGLWVDTDDVSRVLLDLAFSNRLLIE